MYTYLWCFFIFGFFGWCGEVIFAAMVERRFVNRGFLAGPICPIYGFGVVLIDFFLRPVGGSLPALLIGSMLLGSGLEWLAGYLLEKVFHQKWWDYSNEPHNLNGYVCLKFSLLWAVTGAAVERVVVPASRQVVALIPLTLGWVLLSVLLALALADFTVTAAAIVGINRKLKNLDAISGRLRAGSDRLGEGLYAGTVAVEGKAQELSEKAAELREKAAEQAQELSEKAAEIRAKAAEQAMELGEKARETGEDWKQEAFRLREKTEEALRANRFYRRLLKAFPDLQAMQRNEQLEALHQNVNRVRKKSAEALRKRDEAAAAVYEGKLAEGEEKPFAYGMGYTKLFWVFLAGSVIGFVCETLYALAVPPHQFELRTSLVFGPFILVYGFGCLAFTWFLRRMYNQKDILIFFATMVIGASVEYICSFFQQAWFGTVSREYSDSLLNLGGRTNLMYSVFWGILGVLWVKDWYPALSRTLQRIPKKVGRPLTAGLSVFLAIDVALSAGAVYRQSQRVNDIPATNNVQVFFDRYFPDEFLDVIYPHMEYVGRPEKPELPGDGE